MKRLWLVAILAVAATAFAAKDWKRVYSEKIIRVTSSTTGDSTHNIDTIQLSPGGPLFGYRGYILKVKVHPKPIKSGVGSHDIGLVDTVRIVIKREDGIRSPMLIDSTLFAVRALTTTACSTLVQFHPHDSLWMEQIYAYVTVADTLSDTAGITMDVRVTGELLVKD